MYYLHLNLSDEGKEIRRLREEFNQQFRHLNSELKNLTLTEEEKQNLTKQLNQIKEQMQMVNNSICGDKEVLKTLLSTSPNITSNHDIVKYARVETILNQVQDPNWLLLEDELYEWISKMINHSKYGTYVRNEFGNEVQQFPAMLKLIIGEFLKRFDSTPNEMPQELKEKIALVEAKGGKHD